MFSRFFVGYGLELSRIVPLIIFHLKKKYLCKTEAELKEAWLPGDLKYGTRVPGDMLIATIVLCYSVIAPIIILFGLVYFGLGWLILRNQVKLIYFCWIYLFIFLPISLLSSSMLNYLPFFYSHVNLVFFVVFYVTGTQCLCSILWKLWKDVATHAYTHPCSSNITPSYYVWLLWGEEILLCTIHNFTHHTVPDIWLCLP